MTRRLAVVPDVAPRAVAYVRVSKERDDMVSPELQETAIGDYCARQGYQLVTTLTDLDLSGRFWRRRQVEQAVGMIEAGDADVLVVYKVSRVARNRLDWAVAVDRVEAAGGRLEAATEPVDTSTATGRFTRGMLAEMAAFESDRIGEVWREVHARRIGHGLPSRGGDRFGYIRDGDAYSVDPATGPLLAEAYRRVADGQSTRAVVAWLDSRGSRTLAGGPWTRDRLSRVLDSGFGAGLLVRQGRRPGGGVDRRLEALSWAAGAHPPVIDQDTWEAYLAARRGRRRARERDAGSYVLSGLLACGDCGAPMWADRLGRHAGYAFVCSGWKTDPTAARCVSVTRARAEAAVLAWLATYVDDVEAAADRERQRQAAVAVADAGAGALAREVTRLEARQARLLSGWLDGVVPQAAYEAERDRIAAALEATAAALDDLAVRRRQAGVPPVEVAAGLLAEWDELPVADRRSLLSRLLARVEVRPPARRGLRATVHPVERTTG